MSAFLCSPEHIATIARWILANKGHDDPEVLFYSLAKENIESVECRYPDDVSCPDPTAYAKTIKHAKEKALITPVEILKLLGCYRYQSCEHPPWETSNARRVIGEATALAITKLPGYRDAKWAM